MSQLQCYIDWVKERLLKHLGQVILAPSSSVVIKEIIETPMNLGSSNSGKEEVQSAIGGFVPLVLVLPTDTGPASSSA